MSITQKFISLHTLFGSLNWQYTTPTCLQAESEYFLLQCIFVYFFVTSDRESKMKQILCTVVTLSLTVGLFRYYDIKHLFGSGYYNI